MDLKLITAPTIEPITLSTLKLHLRQTSGTFADEIDESQSLAPASYAVADNYTTHVGDSVEVGGYLPVVALHSGTNEATGTVDVKIQESDDEVTWTDFTGGAFTQVTTANDNATQEIEYTGVMTYIRTVAKVLNAACAFGTSVVRLTGNVTEDDLLNDDIQAAREQVETETRRKLLTQTWDYFPAEFPWNENYIKLPFGNLQSVTHVKYTDSDGDQTTLTENTDYIVELNDDQCGRIVLPYQITWPSFTAYPSHPIVIRFVCGWTAAASLPRQLVTATKRIAAVLYTTRGDPTFGQVVTEDKFVNRLLYSQKLWDEFA